MERVSRGGERPSIRRIAAAVVGAMGVVLAATVSVAPASAAPLYPIADPDPFYTAPPDVSGKPNGAVLGSRPMPPLPLFPGVAIHEVKFRSTNSEGGPIAATSLVMIPAGFRPDGPLLSYQHIINGLSPKCAPSRALYTTDPNITIREAPIMNVALQRGWAVVLPDHLGPNSAYGAAKLGGQITLDSIRAAQQTPELALGKSPVAMAGYSGGGMATAWAAALAPSYAPELNIVGVAEGGVPMNITKMGRQLGDRPHPVFGLAMAAAIGLEREYPDRVPMSAQLNPLGIAVRDAMANGCTNDILAAGANRSAPELATSLQLTTDPRVVEVADENSLELYSGVPKAPIFEWHAPTDALIPVDSIVNTVRRYCEAGATVQAEEFPSPDHLTTAVLGAPAALNYLDDRFKGVPAPSNC